jgi:hypothetical protein
MTLLPVASLVRDSFAVFLDAGSLLWQRKDLEHRLRRPAAFYASLLKKMQSDGNE